MTIEQKTIKEFREILQEVWELMPDDITSNDIFYSTQVEPHIIKALVRVRKETREEVIKELIEKIKTLRLIRRRLKIRITKALNMKGYHPDNADLARAHISGLEIAVEIINDELYRSGSY